MNSNFPEISKSEHISYKQSLPLNQIAALNQYINSSSYLNTLLRDGFNVSDETHCKFYGKEMMQRIKNMDSVFQNPTLKHLNEKMSKPFFVYRGINSAALGDILNNRGYVHHPHYMSTSIRENVAKDMFAGQRCCLFKILVDPSENVRYLYISTNSSAESEVLFERDTYLNLEGVQENDGVFVVKVCKTPKAKNIQVQQISCPFGVTKTDVEDELAFLDDIDSKDLESIKLAIEEVVRSLKKTFPSQTNLGEVVKKYVAEILGETTNGMRGGKALKKRVANTR